MSINVKDAAGATVSLPTPNSNGQATAANSAPVVLASDQPPIATTPGPLAHQILPSPSTLLLPSAAASVNNTNVKTAAGTVRRFTGYNAAAYPVFLKLYNKATTPTAGTDTPVATYYLPATSAFSWDVDLSFTLGIGFALTKFIANTDTTVLVAADVIALTIAYS